MELPGFEPGAYRMRSERDTPTPQSRIESFTIIAPFEPYLLFIEFVLF